MSKALSILLHESYYASFRAFPCFLSIGRPISIPAITSYH